MPIHCASFLTSLAREVSASQPVAVQMRDRPTARWDALIHARYPRETADGEAYERLLAALRGVSWIQSVNPTERTIGLTFTEDYVHECVRSIAAGELPGAGASPTMSGKAFGVHYLDPNLSKALHVGHLWNITLGEAFASMLASAGARVTRRLWYGDAGRNMFEATVGVLDRCGGPPRLPLGMKSDHFLGECYAAYVASVHAKFEESGPSPVGRELATFDDRAEDFMRRWFLKEPRVRELWSVVRDWALLGQKQTLDKLGVRLDETLFQSDGLDDLERLIDEGLRRRILHRESDGRVVYQSSKEEFRSLTLVRADGFPTEYARLTSLIWRDQPIAEVYDGYFVFSGEEWSPVGAIFEEFLKKMGPCPLYDKLTLFHHGMVTLQGTKMKSRDGRAILVDELFDRLGAEVEARGFGAGQRPSPSLDLLVNVLIRVYFLARHARRNVPYSLDRILDERRNPGWLVCRALCRIRSLSTSDEDEDAGDFLRVFAMRCQEYPSRLDHAIETRDPSTLNKFLLHTCELCMDMPASARLARVASTLVDFLLTALGLPLGARSEDLVHG